MLRKFGLLIGLFLTLNACSDDPAKPAPISADLCADYSCAENEKCVSVNDEATCESQTNACAPNPCTDEGRTQCLINPNSQEAVCVCDPGLSEVEGECLADVDLCAPNPCTEANRTVCGVLDGAAICQCNEGYEDVDGQCVLPAGSPCENTPCTDENRGVCVPNADEFTCECDAGYLDIDGTCELRDPCDGIECNAPNRGVCVAQGDQAICICDAGYQDANGTCQMPNPCVPDPCPAPGMTCTPDAQAFMCACPTDTVLSGNQCVPADPCASNPCMEANRSVCSSSGLTAVCSCDAGYVETNGACVLDIPASCATVTLGGDAYEPNDCAPLATPLVVGQQQYHTIHVDGDNDWFKFTAQAGRIYRFAVTRSTLSDAYVYLYGSNGTTSLISRDSPESIKYEFDQAGTYYFRVRNYYSVGTGAYSVMLTDEGTDDHGDDAAHATLITDGQIINGDIETAGDNDWFKFTAQAGRIYSLAVNRSTLSDAYVWLYAPDGTTTLINRDSPESIKYEFDQAGTYYFRVRPYSTNDPYGVGTYTVSMTDEGTDDHGDDAANATLITDGQTINGNIETAGDNDWFKFTAQAGRIYSLTVNRSTLSDAYVWLYALDGTTALVNRDSPESIKYEFNQAGTCYFRVRPYSTNDPYGVGTYTVSMTDEGTDDHGDDAANATLITDGQTINGNIETAGDNDWFKFTAQAGRIYSLTVNRSTLSDAYVWLYAPDGTTSLIIRDSPESIKYEFDQAGTYFFRVRSYSTTDPYNIGTYTVIMTDDGIDDHGDTLATATTIAADNQAVNGEIETPGDRDYFAFTAQAGHIYEFSGTRNSLSDMYIYLIDSTGTVVASINSAGALRYRFDQGGTYAWYVRHSSSSSASTVGTYTVRLADLGTDDHSDEAASGTLILTDAAPTNGEIESPNDVDYFRVSLQAGATYRVDTTGLTVAKSVYAPDGSTVVPGSSADTFTFTATQTGIHYIRVRHNFTSVGTYTIKITN